ncbi:hypothetical protein MMC18_004450 [Xylographa bjoerkii]|nr:hypothetical protein [Xylographa bjoerkii]
MASASPITTAFLSSASWYLEVVNANSESGSVFTIGVYSTSPAIPQVSPPSTETITTTTTTTTIPSSSTTSVVVTVPTPSTSSSPSPASTTSTTAVTTTTSSNLFPIQPTSVTPAPIIPSTSSTLTPSTSGTSSVSSTNNIGSGVSSTSTLLSTASATSLSFPVSTIAQNLTGFYAGIGVLAVLLGLALIALAILLFKRRKQSHRDNYAAADEPKVGEDSPMVIADMENTISGLQMQLQQKESQLQNSQAALLQHRRQMGVSTLDDKQVNQRFARLSKSINDWVLTHFKGTRHGTMPTAEVEALALQVSPNHGMLLQDPRGRYLVLRGMVAAVLFQSFSTGELLGQPAFSELKQSIGAKSTVSESSEWRSLTMRLLEKSPSYRRDQASSVQEISEKIDQMTSNLAGLDSSEARLQHLNQVVEAAATLALELEKEQAQYKVERPNSRTFDARSMEDVLQDHRGEALQGEPIQGLVFPSVIKIQGQNQADQGLVIFKAQVIV